MVSSTDTVCFLSRSFLNFISIVFIFFYFEHRPIAGTSGDAKEIMLSPDVQRRIYL